MDSSIRWYQCIHPRSSHYYFYNIITKEVKWHLRIAEQSPKTVKYLDLLGYSDETGIIFYISFPFYLPFVFLTRLLWKMQGFVYGCQRK